MWQMFNITSFNSVSVLFEILSNFFFFFRSQTLPRVTENLRCPKPVAVDSCVYSVLRGGLTCPSPQS